MTARLKALILTQPAPVERSPLRLVELPDPQAGPGAVRLRVLCCGVCRTDLHVAEGELPAQKAQLIPGHQIVGVVDQCGANTARFAIGAQLGVTWLHSACGHCPYCADGFENLCDYIRFTGLHADGGYAEYAVVPEAFAQPLPPGLPAAQAAPLLCAGVIGYRALRLSAIKPGGRLGLFGFGASAHVAIQIANYWNCGVFAFSRNPAHREHALELGAKWAGNLDDDPHEWLDAAVSFAPAGDVVPLALDRLRKGGTLAINAVHSSPIPQLPYEKLYHERAIRSVANCTRRDAAELLELAARIPLQTDVELFPLAQANQALQKLKHSQLRGAAVLQVAGE